MPKLSDVSTLSEYLIAYGSALSSKAVAIMDPLHVPGRDPLPDFSEYRRQPYGAQAHMVAGAIKSFNDTGGVFLNGAMGVGKTIISIIAVDKHAGPKYRAMVVCPDHLINKWEREIRRTIADVDVHTFGKWWEFLDLMGPPNLRDNKRWPKPERATWLVVGRDQIKRCSKSRAAFSKKLVSTGTSPVLDADGYKQYRGGKLVEVSTAERRATCPRCGAVPTEKGEPIGEATLGKRQHCCQALRLVELKVMPGCSGRDVILQTSRATDKDEHLAFPYQLRKSRPGDIVKHAGKEWRVEICGEPMYQFTDQPYWWPPAKIIHQKFRKFCSHLIIDEAHEQQSEESAQSMAAGKLMAVTKYWLALTGTFINGRADSLFPLMMRGAVADMRARGFSWGDRMEFAHQYGCLDRIVTSKAAVSTAKHGNHSMRRTRLGDSSTRMAVRPGIMPSLFSEVVMPRAMFLELEELVENLPGYEETTVPCDLPHDIQMEYALVEQICKDANAKLLSGGNMKFLGATLQTLLGYPDSPWLWPSMFPGEFDEYGKPYHAVGWWNLPKIYTTQNFVGVVTPREFPESMVLPKEQKLVELCLKHKLAGDQTWVYCQMTQKRDVQPRLVRLLQEAGLRAGVLKTGDTPVREREKWIEKNGHLYDVILSHPKMVATGMDLFSFDSGSHNFNHLIFYQCGYELNILRQASRRSWRLGQPKDCTVHLLYCSGTSQELAVALMGLKLAAAKLLEAGEVSDEGLSAMGGGGSDQAALVKRLGEAVNPDDIQRNWSKVQGRPKGSLPQVQTDIALVQAAIHVGPERAAEMVAKEIKKKAARKPKAVVVKPEPDAEPVILSIQPAVEANAIAAVAEVLKSIPPAVAVEQEDELTRMFRALKVAEEKLSSDNWDW
jgi:hypothetical protein